MCVQDEAMPVRHAIFAVKMPLLTWMLDTVLISSPRWSCPSGLPFHICAALPFHLQWDISSVLYLTPQLYLGWPSFSSSSVYGVPDSLSQNSFYISCVYNETLNNWEKGCECLFTFLCMLVGCVLVCQ